MDIEDMNETLIANWNKAVGTDDIVFHLGDFCLGVSGKWNRLLDKLNGKIYLILGNHDLRNFRKSYAGRFESVAMQMNIEVGNQKICLNNYPFLCSVSFAQVKEIIEKQIGQSNKGGNDLP